mgnify:FL=1
MQKLILTLAMLLTVFSVHPLDLNIFNKTPYVSYNGFLKVKGSTLVNQYNNEIQLRGLSSHGLQWYSDLITTENLQYLKENFNINVFRIAMYTAENGYINNKETIKQKAIEITDMAISLDLYVIIDWHILSDGNPNMYKDEAKEFFVEFSNKYKNVPNVIYEICNEPNGQNVTWDNDIKPYAEEIIPVIRNNSPKSLVIVGTPNWCRDLDKVINNTLDFDNVLYSCHFYAGSHLKEIKEKLQIAFDNKLPVFVSEWGTTNYTGDGNPYENESTELINILNENNISWVNWSFCNKNEGSAILMPSYNLNSNIDEYLSESGKIVKSLLLQ